MIEPWRIPVSNADQMAADLRELIAIDPAAQVTLNYRGRPIIGTKGNLTQATIFDRDGGGLNTDDDIVATFLASDFPVPPDGSEQVTVNGRPLRIHQAAYDDFRVACAIQFTSVVTQ